VVDNESVSAVQGVPSEPGHGRRDGVSQLRLRPQVDELVDELLQLSQRGLPLMYQASSQDFFQTVRRDPSSPSGVRGEGKNLRYAAIVALGVGQLSVSAQREMLAGASAAELTEAITSRGAKSADLGGAALTGWAAAEVLGAAPEEVFGRISREVQQAMPVPTVDYSWALTAFVAARKLGDFSALAEQAAHRLLAAQSRNGLFPHALPPQTLGRFRAHVGCYADQVYPIQALSRYYTATGDERALTAANRCAARIVELQGPDGQWWWHYDVRTGDVVEGFPVYSVHQHAMGPMALLDLLDAGGDDHSDAIALGLSWLRSHPETREDLIDGPTGVVWRKVGRREPLKAARSIRAVTTWLRPGLRLGALDRIIPPGVVDHECRPYELGWLLYAWLLNPGV
jgi:hypothetical protein